ncbi:MAG TPA: fatty acid desaturase family protein [Bdellovibrionota bacterium]|jgi:fatty acid desaturase|nr:fatty acid desaturase family protein [Bdellovibrionota bacterium]
MKAVDHLTPAEIKALTLASDLRGWLAVVTTWAMIAGGLALPAIWPTVWAVAISLVILGGRHLALAILMHDASHWSLFKTRRLNEWVGAWLGAYPTWQHLARYRVHHWDHHRFAGTQRDPDVSLVRGFPCGRAGLARKLGRDILGITGIKRVIGLVLMDLGYLEYTVAGDAKPAKNPPKNWREAARTGVKNLHGLVITNLFLLGVLWALGHPALYLLWVGSYLTTFSVFLRVRSVAEHAVTDMNPDPAACTRTTMANPLARVTVAPHRVNYHLEHHLVPNVPYFQLPRFHALLRERGALGGAHVAPGYLAVLKAAAGDAPPPRLPRGRASSNV